MIADIIEFFPSFFKSSFFIVFISSLIVIFNAILSSKTLGGELGKGLKKITAGIIFHTILILTFLALEQNNRGLLTDDQIRMFFLFAGLSGSAFLFFGYLQIYKISRKLKLF